MADCCPGVNSKCTEGLWCGEDTCEEPTSIDKSNKSEKKKDRKLPGWNLNCCKK